MSRDALVVGINTYQYLPSLQAPARDAESVAQLLQRHGEFRVHRLPEVIQDGKPRVGQKTAVTLRELETGLINLFKPKGSAVPHTALFYFSGHGIQREAGIHEGYLALGDSNPDQGFYGLSLFWLRRLLQESPVRQRIILLDCCHSGELLNFLEADPGARPGTDRLFMAASREYETAYEALNGSYSVFTQALLSGLDPNRLDSGIVTNHSLTDWVNHTLKGEIQQPLFESSGSEIILTRRTSESFGVQPPTLSERAGSSALGQAVQSKDICPYRGLEFFDEAHSDYFFGREELTHRLIDLLNRQSFVAVVGASGSGKSSLIRAGLIAQLRQGKKLPGSEHWRIKLLTPTEHPLKSLAAAFIDPDLSELERAEQLRRAEVFLQDKGAGLAQLVRASLSVEASTPRPPHQTSPRLLLVIDQFEEVFTLAEGSQSERQRQEFLDCLLEALSLAGDCLSVVLVLRADFINKCALYPELAHQIERHQVMVPPLKYEQIKATIVRPAKKVGLVCEPNLVYTMMSDVIGAPGELPLLQYTLLELWRRRRIGTEGGVARLALDAYQELGGVRGTLQKRATEVFYSLTPEEQGVAKRIFLALTQLGEGTEDTRRRVMKSELVSPRFPIELVEQVLEKLVAAKLVVTSQEIVTAAARSSAMGVEQTASAASAVGAPVESPPSHLQPVSSSCWWSHEIVDVTHEALIRNWPLLREWLDDSREMLRRQRRIEQAAQEWAGAGQPPTGEYLLHGLRLRDAEDFLKIYPQELSAVAQHYINVSCAEMRRARRESRQLRIAIPSLLAAMLAVVLSQYHTVIQSQAKKDNQLQAAAARERAAIAQSMLQDPQADPMAALLISRLAAEGSSPSYEAQTSLRAALQDLRLQLQLQGHQAAVQHIAFSPSRQYLATASRDGTIRLWKMDPQTIYNTRLSAAKVLSWPTAADESRSSDIRGLHFSPDGQQVLAIAANSPLVKIWSVESGRVLRQLASTAVVTQVSYSPTGDWIATAHTDGSLALWQAATGKLQVRVPQPRVSTSLQFSADGKTLLTAGDNDQAQLWRLLPNAAAGVKLEPAATFSHGEPMQTARFSPQGRWVATLSDGTVKLWDAATGQLRHRLATPLPAFGTLDQPEGFLPPLPKEMGRDSRSTVHQFAFSPDEQRLAVLDTAQRVWVWNLQTGQIEAELAPPTPSLLPSAQAPPRPVSPSQLLSFSPDGRLLAVGDLQPSQAGRGSAVLWDWSTERQVGRLLGHQGVTVVQFSPDGTYVVTGDTTGSVRLWTAERGGELPTLNLPETSVQWAMFLPGDSVTSPAAVAQAGTPPPTKPLEEQSQQTDSAPTAVGIRAFSNSRELNGSALLSLPSHWHAYAFRWSLPASQATSTAPSRSDDRRSAPPFAADRSSDPSPQVSTALSTAVTTMVTLTPDGTLQRWQILTERPALKPVLLPETVSPVAAIRTDPSVAQLWNLVTALQQRLPVVQPNAASEPARSGFAAAARQLAEDRGDPLPASAKLLEQLGIPQNAAALSSLALSPTGHYVAIANIEGWVELYRLSDQQSPQLLHRLRNWRRQAKTQPLSTLSTRTQVELDTPANHPSTLANGDPTAIRHLSFSPNGQQILGIADDLTVRLWDVQSGQLVQVLQGHEATIRQARYSLDGRWIVTASWDRTARLWQAGSGELKKILRHSDAVSSASLSSDHKRIVTTSWDGSVRLWSLDGEEGPILLKGHTKAVLDAQFSPDSQLLITAGADGNAYLWNGQTGDQQAQLRPYRTDEPAEAILQSFFSPDGQYVATLTKSGRIHLWAATWDMLLKLARDRSLRQLTPEECRQYLRLAPEECPILPHSEDLS